MTISRGCTAGRGWADSQNPHIVPALSQDDIGYFASYLAMNAGDIARRRVSSIRPERVI
jgi:hypothetical protein